MNKMEYALEDQKSAKEEELIIRNLVDDIYQVERKIAEINTSLDVPQNLNLNIIKLEDLKILKEQLQKKANYLSITLENYVSANDDKIKSKLLLIQEHESKLQQYREQLNAFNAMSFQSLLLSKYVLSNNNNDFLSNEQISDVINKSQQFNESLHEIQKLSREISVTKISQNLLFQNIAQNRNKLQQIQENIKMLKEEKYSINSEIVDLISHKESLEIISKINLGNLFSQNNNNLDNNNFDSNLDDKNINTLNNKKIKINEPPNENVTELPIDLCPYHLLNIDSYKIASKICEGISDLIDLNSEQKDLNKTTIALNNESFPELISYTSFTKERSNKLDIIIFAIKSEIDSYLSSEFKNKDAVHKLIDSIFKILIAKISINIKNHNLVCYICCNFIEFYYDSIIEFKLKFINKDYKIIKKEFKKVESNISLELSKYENSLEDLKSKNMLNEAQIELLQNDSQNQKLNKQPLALSENEQKYLQICSKGNGLIKKINALKNDIELLEKDTINKTDEINSNKDKLTQEINQTNKKIINLNNQIEQQKIKTNNDIINYRKIIADKFNIIKTQLQIYKSKYGSNLTIYNRLIDSINSTIKNTYNKSEYDINNYRYKDLHNNYNNMSTTSLNNNIIKSSQININNSKLSLKQQNKPSLNLVKSTENIRKYDDINFDCKKYNFISKGSNKKRNKSTKRSQLSQDFLKEHFYDNINNEQNKNLLVRTIKNLENKILKSENISNSINIKSSLFNKIIPLTKITFCYFRELNPKSPKYSPLANISPKLLCEHPFNFIKSSLSLNKSYDSLRIVPSTHLDPIDFSISQIETTVVNSVMKLVIEIHRNFRKYKAYNKNGTLQDFVEKESKKPLKLNKNDYSKCATNKYFNFSLIIKGNKRIEFIICSYDDFKLWINGLAFMIKNKNDLINSLYQKIKVE